MLGKLTQERRQVREHWRMHREDPAWHIVIKTPEEAREKRAEILGIIRGCIDDVGNDSGDRD